MRKRGNKMKNKTTRILITVLGGWFGLHKFLDHKVGTGILYLFTGGIFGIGWIVDIVKAFLAPVQSSPYAFTYVSNTSNTLPPNATIHFEKNFLIIGVKYECLKNPSVQRSYAINNTNLNTPVHVEKYFYQDAPAYMIVNSISNLDIGVLSAGAASWLTDYYSKGTVFARLTDAFDGSFHVDIIVYS